MHTNGNYNNNVVSLDHDQPDNNCIRGMQHGCVNVTNIVEDLKTGKFWSMFKLIKSPGDGHCLMHSVVNSLKGMCPKIPLCVICVHSYTNIL